ncbi:bifunctional sugar-1-phosphate nucleotidylyltransferase/acetyltransferase [[Eubacterium] cellulosolvens]
MPFQAVLLTAGEGIRLRPLTVSRVKGMIPIANKPILEYVLESLAKNNIRDIVMVVGYKKERIMAYFEDGSDFGVKIKYVEQRKQLGTAHALMQAKDVIKKDFIALPGDNIVGPEAIAKLMEKTKSDASILVTTSDTPSRYGVVGMTGNKVIHIIEKPPIIGELYKKGVPTIFSLAFWEPQEKTISNIISTGIYRFTPKIFKNIDELMVEQKYSLTELIQYMLSKDLDIRGIKIGSWADAVYPWDVVEMNALALRNIQNVKSGRIEHGAIIRPPVVIGEDTVIRSNAYIMGPAVIGSGCEIGPNTCIMPSSTIGNNVTIDPFTEIKHSVIMDDCQIGSSSTISHSVISFHSTLGSHFVSESTKNDVKLKSRHYEIKNIGSIVGEDCNIGYCINLAPGIIVGANCRIASMTRLSENVPDNTNVT